MNKNKISKEENIIIENEIKNEEITKEPILVLNNDPINFINIITALNKKYIVKQATNVEKLIELKNQYENIKIIVDITKLDTNEKNELNKNLFKDLIIFYSDVIDIIEENKIISSLKKPFSMEDINNI